MSGNRIVLDTGTKTSFTSNLFAVSEPSFYDPDYSIQRICTDPVHVCVSISRQKHRLFYSSRAERSPRPGDSVANSRRFSSQAKFLEHNQIRKNFETTFVPPVAQPFR